MLNRREFLGAAVATCLGGAPAADRQGGDALTTRLGGALTLMSYNIRMGCGHDDPFALKPGSLGHLPQCAEVIRSFAPDVVGIQEIDRKSVRAGGVDQAAELGRLCGLHATYVPKTSQKGGDYGLAVLSKEKPLSVSHVLMPGSCHTRLLMMLEFGRFLVANTHFPLTSSPFPLRENAAAIARSVLGDWVRKTGKPCFFMGDFNSEPASAPIKSLREDFALLTGDTQPTWPARADTKHRPQCIDFIFVDKAHAARFDVLSRTIRPVPEATDHAALVVKVAERKMV